MMLCAAAAAAAAAVAGAAGAPKPHLVMMVIDDVGWADLSMRGSAFPTPNIDALAQSGVILDRYYVQPVCSPTRSAFMTGRYPFHTGLQHMRTIAPGSTAHLPTDYKTIAEHLRDAGYETHMVGKWHLGYAKKQYTPAERGFRTFTGYLQGQIDYYNHTIILPGTQLDGMDYWSSATGSELKALWSLDKQYSMDHYTQSAADVIDNLAPGKSLFLYYAHQEIHIPIEYPPAQKFQEACAHVPKDVPSASVNRQALCSMMADLDDKVGAFVELLKGKGMWENTFMVVTTDNGGMTHWQAGWPASASSNWPLRGGKATLFEGGVRVTGFVVGGHLPAAAGGRVVSTPFHAVDLVPTFAALAGVPAQPEWDGEDMWPAISGGKIRSEPREIPLNVYQSGTNFSALIYGDLKVMRGFWGVCDGYWKADASYEYLNGTEHEELKLFNLTADPTERVNLASSRPDAVKDMLARLEKWADPKTGYVDPQNNDIHPLAVPNLHNGTWAPFL